MYLIQQQQAELASKALEFGNLTKCPTTPTSTNTTTTTTMKMSNEGELVRKNGINGNLSNSSANSPCLGESGGDNDDMVVTTTTTSSPNINFSRLSLGTGSAAGGHRLPLTENKNVLAANAASADDSFKPGNNNGQRKSATTITGERLQFFKGTLNFIYIFSSCICLQCKHIKFHRNLKYCIIDKKFFY